VRRARVILLPAAVVIEHAAIARYARAPPARSTLAVAGGQMELEFEELEAMPGDAEPRKLPAAA
jgi:hypothetical protein